MRSLKSTVFKLICLVALLLSTAGAAFAVSPGSGDKVLDSRLDAVNAYAAKDMQGFVSGLSGTYNVEKAKIEGMLAQGMKPADVYMTLRIARITNQTPEQVEKAYLSNPGKGWGVISKSLGIKPGSDEFKSLKSGAKDLTDAGKGKAKGKEKGDESGAGKGTGSGGKGSDRSGGSGKGDSGGKGQGGSGGKGKDK